MTWRWRTTPSAPSNQDESPAQPPGGWSSQGDAESWIGEQWPALLAAGVTDVTLVTEADDGKTDVYSMSLLPPGVEPPAGELSGDLSGD
jgi:hypothetical protein